MKRQRITELEFLCKAKEKWGHICDYSKVKFKNMVTHVTIYCIKHNIDFTIKPQHHLKYTYSGCPECFKENFIDTEEFIRRSISKNGPGLDYSESVYISRKKVKIICPKEGHGEFWIDPSKHYNYGYGCPECQKERYLQLRIDRFKEKAVDLHDGYYIYDNLQYVAARKKANITCPTHGDFLQTPDAHLAGKGCPKCKSSRGERLIRKYLQELGVEFREQVKFVHCKYIRQLLFDFVVYTNPLTMIEFQGPHHYMPVKFVQTITDEQSEENFRAVLARDEIKRDYCESRGYKLLEIHYKDIENIKNILIDQFNKT